VRAFECDITDETSVASAFEQIDRQSESDAGSGAGAFPCILVNAAGYVSVLPLEETSQKEAMANFLPNLLGPFNLSTAFFRMYRWRVDAAGVGGEGRVPPGRIVSISSQASHVALDGHGAYCASKAGLNGLTRCMANEWGGRGVTANTVSPTGESLWMWCSEMPFGLIFDSGVDRIGKEGVGGRYETTGSSSADSDRAICAARGDCRGD